MKKSILIVALFAFTFSACKKSSEETPGCTLTEANFVGAYKITAVKYKSSPSATEVDDNGIIVENCSKDDIISFSANHTYASTDIGTKCSPDGSETGIWSLSGTTLTVDGDVQTLENFSCSGFTIVETGFLTADDIVKITVQKQ